MLSHVQLFATLWTVAHQAPLFMGYSRQEYWSGLPSPPPEDLLGPGIQTVSLVSPALADGFPTTVPNQMNKILKIVSQRIKQSPKKMKISRYSYCTVVQVHLPRKKIQNLL